LDCEVLEITRTNYDGKESLYLGTCERIEIGKDTVITKKKDFDESASKGKIADLTAQIIAR
jgi:hypothetical protein